MGAKIIAEDTDFLRISQIVARVCIAVSSEPAPEG
jgi:hypothetical protein